MGGVLHLSQDVNHCGKMGHWKVRCSRNKDRQAVQKSGNKPAKSKDSKKIDAVDINVSDQQYEHLAFDTVNKKDKDSYDNEDIIVEVDV